MKTPFTLLLLLLITLTGVESCAQKEVPFKPKVVYQSKALLITQLSPNTYEHTSYKQTDEFGYVPCNGLLVKDGTEVIVLDTPTNTKSAEALIKWVTKKLHCTIKAVVPTHFHDDCLGGLEAFHQKGIPSYAYYKTMALAKEARLTTPQNSFSDTITLPVGQEKVMVTFFGEGHTKDNVVGYFPKEHILFGGCLIKALEASKGYLGDANTADWSATVAQVKKAYPEATLIVPGHGDYGDRQLLDYTITLFQPQ
ncbi:subclass B1 metallo-beta-lactamase [Flavobacterium phycosphaerae]|uniref:subclass B1 metallo-beta-lactamase n=1 Tax=Flavobacterium phycosphaerae TaxID=2697515 RepID=UPI00138B03C0|nr:subclass B1 metallo-beta-lactamase [Flavobacterium phycosphaerae]